MGLSFVPTKAKFFGAIFWPFNKSFIDQVCFGQDIGFVLFFFCVFMHPDFVSVNRTWLILIHLDLVLGHMPVDGKH